MVQKRPPIIVVLGSVDHGKTTLLDYIRKTNVAAKEPGAITQSTGGYEIEHPSRHSTELSRSPSSGQAQKITFIDTPGHEAFTAMRSRGATVADLAILLVAADDSVKPQTKEAIKILKETETPFVVAINKVDKNNADPERAKNDLAKESILLEGRGGDISFQEISAKTGQGINELLDLLLLATEVLDLQYDPEKPGEGFILEAKMDRRRGIAVSAIVKDGTLRSGDQVAAGSAGGKIKIMEDFRGKGIKEARPSLPVTIFGFEKLPKVGEVFLVGGQAAKESEEKRKIAEAEKGALNLILRGDVSGSVEALSQIIRALPLKGEQAINIVDEGIGDISDGDVKLAISTDSLIIGFNVRTTKPAENLARDHRVEIFSSNVIYDLIKALEERLASGVEKITGKLEILATFSKKGTKQVIGGKVTEGEIKNNARLGVERRGAIIGIGKIVNLQQKKADVQKVEAGNECGLMFDSETEIRIGDVLIAK